VRRTDKKRETVGCSLYLDLFVLSSAYEIGDFALYSFAFGKQILYEFDVIFGSPNGQEAANLERGFLFLSQRTDSRSNAFEWSTDEEALEVERIGLFEQIDEVSLSRPNESQ
jgi:hypothetical protein